MNTRRWILYFLTALTVLRLVYAGMVELSPDEAYYHLWSERLDYCYFSKGPGVAWTIWLSGLFFGPTELGVRFFSPVLAFGTSWMMYLLGRRLYGETAAVWTVLTINMVPIFNAGSLLMTIDPLSIFFWAAALYTFWRAQEAEGGGGGVAWWAGTGLLIGAGWLCKWTNAMELLSMFLFLLLSPERRRELVRPGFYLSLLCFLPFLLPPILWNANHDWVTWTHLSERGGLQKSFQVSPGELAQFFFQHFGVYSPVIFGGVLAAVCWGLPLARRDLRVRYLLAFGLPLWAMYSWLSFAKGESGEANWTAPAMVSLTVLTAALWSERARESRRLGNTAIVGLVLGAAVSLLALNTDLLRAVGFALPYKRDPSARLRGWRAAAAKVEEVRARVEAELGESVFLIGSDRGVAATVGFYLRDRRVEGAWHPSIYIPESQHVENQFSFWPRYDEFLEPTKDVRPRDPLFSEEQGYNPFHGRSALFITDRIMKKPPSTIRGAFESYELVGMAEQTRRDLPLREWRIYLCRNYKSAEL
jgi:4-amino-4-deoxy-L-arabinose transferase-like glycosyltransferase